MQLIQVLEIQPINYLFLEAWSLKSWSESSLWGLPARDRGESNVAGGGGASPPGRVCPSMESAWSYEYRILWSKNSRLSWEEDCTLRWICSCLASSLPWDNSSTRFLRSESEGKFSIFKPEKGTETTSSAVATVMGFWGARRIVIILYQRNQIQALDEEIMKLKIPSKYWRKVLQLCFWNHANYKTIYLNNWKLYFLLL